MKEIVKEFIIKKAHELSGLSKRKASEKISKDISLRYNEQVAPETIRKMMRKVDVFKEKIEKANESVEEKEKPYEFDGETYTFDGPTGVFSMTKEEVDMLFLDYSEYGNNLSQEEMLQKYNLKIEVWNFLKRVLRLVKKSHVCSHLTIDGATEEQLEEIADRANSARIDRMKEKMVLTHRKRFKAEAERCMKIVANQEYFVAHLKEYLIDYWKPIEINYKRKEPVKTNELFVFMGDQHIGKKHTEQVIQRMDKIFQYIISRPETSVTICEHGDLAESLCPTLMHDSQVEGMENFDTYKTIFDVVDLFQKFLLGLWRNGKNVKFYGIGGNHDRLSRMHDQDIRRSGASIIYECIKRGLQETDIVVKHFREEKVNIFESERLAFVIHHGDDGFSNRKPEDILWKNHVVENKHHVIVHADKHTFSARETKNGTMIGIPALAGRGEYDGRLDLWSEPGIVVVTESETGAADVFLKRL